MHDLGTDLVIQMVLLVARRFSRELNGSLTPYPGRSWKIGEAHQKLVDRKPQSGDGRALKAISGELLVLWSRGAL